MVSDGFGQIGLLCMFHWKMFLEKHKVGVILNSKLFPFYNPFCSLWIFAFFFFFLLFFALLALDNGTKDQKVKISTLFGVVANIPAPRDYYSWNIPI